MLYLRLRIITFVYIPFNNTTSSLSADERLFSSSSFILSFASFCVLLSELHKSTKTPSKTELGEAKSLT